MLGPLCISTGHFHVASIANADHSLPTFSVHRARPTKPKSPHVSPAAFKETDKPRHCEQPLFLQNSALVHWLSSTHLKPKAAKKEKKKASVAQRCNPRQAVSAKGALVEAIGTTRDADRAQSIFFRDTRPARVQPF